MTGTLRLAVELETAPATDDGSRELQVAGRVRLADGEEHPFVGWVGLMAVLHDAVVLAEAGT